MVEPNCLATKEKWEATRWLLHSPHVAHAAVLHARCETRSESGMEVQNRRQTLHLGRFPVSLNTRGLQVTRLSSETRDNYTPTEIISRLVGHREVRNR